MFHCDKCGGELNRTRRSLLEKIRNQAAYVCPKCADRVYIRRSPFSKFTFYSQCPKCGRRSLSRYKSIDPIDRLNKNPLRMLLGLFRAPLYHCTFCRLQFWDLRKREPPPSAPEDSLADSETSGRSRFRTSVQR